MQIVCHFIHHKRQEYPKRGDNRSGMPLVAGTKKQNKTKKKENPYSALGLPVHRGTAQPVKSNSTRSYFMFLLLKMLTALPNTIQITKALRVYFIHAFHCFHCESKAHILLCTFEG